MTKPGKIEFGDVTEPKVGRGQILSGAKQTGICDSNVPLNHDRHLFTPCSVVQGYESHGHVEAVGTALKGVGVGTKATAGAQLVCGKRCVPQNIVAWWPALQECGLYS
jgi:D-arabinose 1-dehydrogenase-like Zn-dependent alcohol dehydrogenase